MALNKRYIYLAGKIKLGHGATGYRAKVAPLLRKRGIYSLDPLRGKYAAQSWENLDSNEVVVRDLQDIGRAHVVLAVMMKYKDSSFGTPCEIMYAWERRIPVILITNEQYLAKHFWPRSLCSHIFFVDEKNGETFDSVLLQVVEHICHWYGSELEEEIYNNPQLTQKQGKKKATLRTNINLDMTPAPSFIPLKSNNHTDIPKDANPDEEAARAAAREATRTNATPTPRFNSIKGIHE